MSNRKEIYFCIDGAAFQNFGSSGIHCVYEGVVQELREGSPKIVTSSMANLSFDLVTMGYDVYLCYRDRKVKIEEGVILKSGRELDSTCEFTDDWLELFIDGEFDDLLGRPRFPKRKTIV